MVILCLLRVTTAKYWHTVGAVWHFISVTQLAWAFPTFIFHIDKLKLRNEQLIKRDSLHQERMERMKPPSKSQRPGKPRAAIYRAVQLTSKISHAIVLTVLVN